jgi:hypothetical protein
VKIYIGGPMRGYNEFNFPAFDAMRDRIKTLDSSFEVVSPADLDREIGFDETQNSLDGFSCEDAMERDIKAMRDVDALILLSGSEWSKGARVEEAYARYRGIPVFYEAEFHQLMEHVVTKTLIKGTK